MILPELVVFSHLPWTFVWQRPQHVISRLARGRRVRFVEECAVTEGLDRPRLRTARDGVVERIWWEVPGPPRLAGFDDPDARGYPDALAELLGSRPNRIVWTYTPMALPLIDRLDRRLLVYDVMDDLASFAQAAPRMRDAQGRLLGEADLVFTGGPSIHAGVADRARAPVHLFRSGVEPEHYAAARALRRPRPRPVAGYVGVIDERIDLGLVAGLAARLPEWDVEMVGPVFKIDPADLPQAPNLRYPGMQPYERLPQVMGGFDVALMPMARNAATRSISPTKTLEYLAAGLPVVSTPVPDVVADHAGVVDIAADAEGFAAACARRLGEDPTERDARVAPLLRRRHWDVIAGEMDALLRAALLSARPAAPAPSPAAAGA